MKKLLTVSLLSLAVAAASSAHARDYDNVRIGVDVPYEPMEYRTAEGELTGFDIDLGICVSCGYCVEVCPEDAIRMDTGILDLASYSREGMKLDIHELMDPELRKPISDCSLKFPHKCELTGGEVKGSWAAVDGA